MILGSSMFRFGCPILFQVDPNRLPCFLSLPLFPSLTVVSVTKPKPVMTTASLLGAARVAKAASVISPELPPLIQPQTAIILPPKGQPVVEERDSIPAPMKASILVQNINTPSPVTTTSDTAVATKAGGVISPIELQNSLITLLTDNPKGLTIKVSCHLYQGQ